MESLFPPPNAAGARYDPDGQHFAQRLLRFAWARALVFGGAGAVVVVIFSRQSRLIGFSYSLRAIALVVLIAWLSTGFQVWAARARFYMIPTALGLIVLDQALFATIAYLTGGVSSAASSLLGVSCLVGGFLLGVPGAVTAGFAGVIFFSLIFLIVQGAPDLLPPDQPMDLYRLSGAQAAYYYVFTILMLVLVSLLSSVLADRLARTGGALQEARVRVEHAERLAALGRLAAGLAHEIRNPLSAISGSVQMLQTGVEREDDRDLCDIVLREARRLDDLVTDMVNLSKRRPLERAIMDLGVVVRDVIDLASRSGRGIEDVYVRRRGVEHALVLADASQVRQLVWNLVRNAVQASGVGGEVRVILECDKNVRLRVEDDGVGIDSAAKEHLFDAFFTTRSQGTGLGLAVVKRIADEHGFTIDVRSDQGEGAQFVVDFGPERSAELT